MKTIKRYFLIFYKGNSKNGEIAGNYALEYNSMFPSQVILDQYIKKNDDTIIDIVITNIIQLTKTEYDCWCEK